jgi:D-xylose transport system substrate-binding protein
MKTATFVLSLAVLLSACAPAVPPAATLPPPPTSVPTAAPAQPTPAPITVGLSFADVNVEPWMDENDLISQLLTDKGYNVVSEAAQYDAEIQNDQIDHLVAQGARALIIIAANSHLAEAAVNKAAAAGVKIVAFDRLIKSTNISAYIGFDNVEVGRQQALGLVKALQLDNGQWTTSNPVKLMKMGGGPEDNNAILVRQGQDAVFQPYVDKGLIKVVADQWVNYWNPDSAQKAMGKVLTDQNNKIDAVVASNDDMALAALQELKPQGLAGKVAISGADATAPASNSVVKGELTVTVFKDVRLLSPLAVDVVDKLLKGQPIPNLKPYTMAELTNDKSKAGSVMADLLPVVQVTKDNVYDVVVKSGFQQYDAVYADIPDAQRPPKP